MASYSFPETTYGNTYNTFVLYSPTRKQFLGWTGGRVCYGWTQKPEVTVVGGSCLSPISRALANSFLGPASERAEYDGVHDLQVVEVVITRDPHDRNRLLWRFAS